MGWGMLYAPLPEPTEVPPDPTQRVLTWGGAYPCLALQHANAAVRGFQCGGLMLPGKRCFREGDGRLWRRFKCNRCGRVATDWKAE